MNDSRVQAAQEAGRGGRVRDEKETAAASSLTPAVDGRQEASPLKASDSGGSVPAEANQGSGARGWIDSWRERQGAGKA